jgi:hypothetical protein
LRLINAARLVPLEELMAEMKNGGTGGNALPSGGSPANTPATPVGRGAMAGAYSAQGSAFPRSEVAASSVASFEVAPEKSDKANGTAKPDAYAAPAAPVQDSPKTNAPATRVDGITLEEVAEIKATIQATQKFVAELIEHADRWELDRAELRICFSPDKQTFAGLLDGRDTLEKIRAVSSKVLGRSVRVCAKIESVAAAAASANVSGTQELRARFERDPMVRSMLQRFGGKITEVRRQQEES